MGKRVLKTSIASECDDARYMRVSTLESSSPTRGSQVVKVRPLDIYALKSLSTKASRFGMTGLLTRTPNSVYGTRIGVRTRSAISQ